MDSQVQDALVQISSLSNRLQRERAVAAASAHSMGQTHNAPSPSQPQLDNYLEYFDDPEPNASELDDMIDDEPPNPSHFAHSTLANDIKSECEDNVDEYDAVERGAGEEEDHDADDADMRNYMFSTLEKRQQQQHQHHRLQHLQRLQSRAFYEEFRNKRSRSLENISSTQQNTTPLVNPTSSNHCNSNVSFVRPTFAKPLEVVSTTTQSHGGNGNNNNSSSSSSSASNASVTNDNEPVSNSTPRSSSSHQNHHHQFTATSSITHSQQNPRFEMSVLNAQSILPPIPPTVGQQHNTNATAANAMTVVPSAATPDLCDCKTDPDAMFLMSLLPDIQKLNGRDRGKIKIAFQNILQDYLYPD